MAKIVLGPVVFPAVVRAICQLLDAGGAPGVMELYDKPGRGARRLATLRLALPCAKSYDADSAVFGEFKSEFDAPGRGRAAWAVLLDGSGVRVLACDVGEDGDKHKPCVVLDDAFIRAGDLVRVKSFTLRLRQPQSAPEEEE